MVQHTDDAMHWTLVGFTAVLAIFSFAGAFYFRNGRDVYRRSSWSRRHLVVEAPVWKHDGLLRSTAQPHQQRWTEMKKLLQ